MLNTTRKQKNRESNSGFENRNYGLLELNLIEKGSPPSLKGEQKHFDKLVCHNKMLLEEEGI